MRKRLFAALTISLACAACQPGALLNMPNSGKQPSQDATIAAAVLKGRVMAPAGVISAGAGNVIAPGGGNFRTLAADTLEETPLANAEIYLADVAGDPLPGFPTTKTDAKGNYTLPQVKAGYTFLIVAKAKDKDGQDVFFQTIAKATELGATADVDAATTLVTAGLVADSDGTLGTFNKAKFKTATDATKRSLRADNLPDFGDRAAVLAKIQELSEQVEEIRTALDDIKQQLADIQQQLADLKGQLAGALSGKDGEEPADCGAFFTHLDADGNGRVPLAEWLKGFDLKTGQDSPKDIFFFVDHNADGEITREEFLPECEAHQNDDQGGNHEGSCEDGFRFMDQDHSGWLSLDELKHGQEMGPRDQSGMQPPPPEEIFKHMDRDGNNQISKEEFLANCGNQSGPMQGPPPGDCEGRFTMLDRNGDKAVDPAEFGMGFRSPDGSLTAEQAFSRLDVNHDNRLDHDEFMQTCGGDMQQQDGSFSCEDGFKHQDMNGDGTISLDELRQTYRADAGSPAVEDVFKAWDRNADGKVSGDEYIAQCQGQPMDQTSGEGDCMTEFARRDANGDQRLSAAEMGADVSASGEAGTLNGDHDGDGYVDPAEFCGS